MPAQLQPVNRFPNSFARGVPFQDNPRTGDCRISGTTASLAGLEANDPAAVVRILLMHAIVLSTGGIPLLYLGDEVGQLNDYGYLGNPAKADDSRWVGRPAYPADRYASRKDPMTDAGAIATGLGRLIEVRRQAPEFAGGRLVPAARPCSVPALTCCGVSRCHFGTARSPLVQDLRRSVGGATRLGLPAPRA